MRIILPTFLGTFICLILFCALSTPVFSQSNNFDFGFATYVPVNDEKVEDGSVVITSQNGIYLSRYPYDDTLTGVVSLKPAVVLGLKKDGTYPLNTKGSVNVRVSTLNGAIAKGDFLTSSTIPGVAMRATKSGTVLGTALGDFASENKEEIGKVPTYIEVKFNELGVQDKEFAVKKDVAMWRVGAGAILAIVTTVLCFVLYGKYTGKVVEAMARNPIASKSLKRNMFVQGFFLFLFVATGYAVSYFLLRG